MKNNFFVLRENDSSHCIRVFVNLLVIFLVITFITSSVSASDESDIWKTCGSKKLYKGDTYTVNDYKIEAFDFPKLKKGSIATPFIGLKVYKNNDYVKTITLGLHKSGICDEIKITAIALPSGQVIEWQDDVYRPWGKIEVAIKGKPKFNIKISTDKKEYQQNSMVKVDIIVRNEGNSDAKNVELEWDSGGLEVGSTNIDESRARFTRRDPITGKLNLKTPETIDKKERYTISVTVTGKDLEGEELLPETKSVSIDVLPDSGSIYVQSTPSGAKINIDRIYKGTAPITISDVSVGYHTIKLTKSGYKDYTAENIYVSAGETKRISASLALTPRVIPTARPTPTVPKTGYVSVSSNPINANIEIDGDYKGTTPLNVPVSVGYHTIKLTKSGYGDYIKEMYVSAGRTVQVSKKLAQKEPLSRKVARIAFLILIGVAFFKLYSRISKKRLPTPQPVRTTPTKPAQVKPKPAIFTSAKPKPINPNEYTLDNGETIYILPGKAPRSGKEAHIYKTSQHGYLAKIYKKPKGWQEKAVEEIVGEYNVVAKHPDVSDLFCWPKAVIVKPKLGVLIPEAPPNLMDVNIKFLLFSKSFKTLTSNRRGNWKMRVEIALKMARSMRSLHGSGLCHGDISFNNILVDPRTGEMRWIDLDGLVIPGDPHHRPAVGGTLQYMAPELITGNAKPSINTDIHSLAVLIYELLLMNHPLLCPGRPGRKDIPMKIHKGKDGKRLDIDVLELGKYALYVEHPTNKYNRPIGDYIGSSVLGKEIQELMRRTFVDGIQNPDKRPTANVWEGALRNLLDDIKPCKNRSCDLKYYPKTPNKKCPWCN